MTEVDQWISNSVFKIVRTAGVPLDRTMSMRWILTWKEAPEGTKAKPRLVTKGFTGQWPIFIVDQGRSTHAEQAWSQTSSTVNMFEQIQD